MKGKRVITALACLGLLVGLFSGCGTSLAGGADTTSSPSASPSGEAAEADEVAFAENYDDIYNAIQNAMTAVYGPRGYTVSADAGIAASAAAPEAAPTPAPAAEDAIVRTGSLDAAYWHREWGTRR